MPGVILTPGTQATKELVTQTYSNAQSSTIDDSDVLPTTSSIIGQGGSIVSFPTTSSLSSLSLDYDGQDGTSSTTLADDEDTITIFPTTIDEATSAVTYSSSLHTSRSLTVTGFLTTPATTETVDLTTSRPTTSVLYYTDSTSKLHHPSSTVGSVGVTATFSPSTMISSNTAYP